MMEGACWRELGGMADSRFLDLCKRPLKFADNRVWRTYLGGELLDRWQGREPAEDGEYPEQWIASVVTARNVGREQMVEGLSRVRLDDGSTVTLKEAIESDPVSFLGARHVRKFGANPAVLIKLLDAGERLAIQVHPDRDYAQRQFHSPFGKTESWYVLGGRAVNGEQPYVLLGFKSGVTKEQWRRLFEEQDIAGMIDALHKVPVNEGDVFLVEGGVPHAIGAGCFMIEVQEPTDYTMRVEKKTPRGLPLPDLACHQGVGFDRMMDCFHYEAHSYEETLARWKKIPEVIHETSGGRLVRLIGHGDTDRFRVHRLDVASEWMQIKEHAFMAAIVVSGSGKLVWANQEMNVRKADELFLPASLCEFSWINTAPSEGDLQVVLCMPPKA